MNNKSWVAGLLLLAALHVSLVDQSAAQSSDESYLPPNSVYHLQVPIEDQLGEITGLDRYRGNPVLVTMFYASCPHVCPLLISTIQLTESKLSIEERSKLRVLTISIDPERDTPTLLNETMQRHSVDSDRWSMVRPAPDDLRSIAGVFGVKYKKLPDGEFNHTTRIVLLDSDGTMIGSTEQLGRHDAAFLEAIKSSMR